MTVADLARALRREATDADERRLLVLTGDRERSYERLAAALDALDVPLTGTTLVGPEDRLRCERVPQSGADRLLGTTREVVALDAHEAFRPNALGSLVGAVDGGGLLVLLAPPLGAWPDRRDGFDASMAAPPFDVADVTGRFRARFVETLRAHPGIAIASVEAGGAVRVRRDGLTDPPPRLPPDPVSVPPPAEREFPAAAYEACLTGSQVDAVAAFEALREPNRAVVLEADRGRGKSSAAGLAAGAFAAAGEDVLVTAPAYPNAAEVVARAADLLDSLGPDVRADGSPPRTIDVERGAGEDGAERGGRVRYLAPTEAVDEASRADVVVVDEAAALPVSTLESLLAADRVAFATTVHGYEGAGRGFSVRFRDRLAEGRHEVTAVRPTEPIRYAAGDPVETWAFRALLLDARPPVEPVVAGATPETVSYRTLAADDLVADERLLREAFGLLVLAHYRTEPDDLARLLDAPNIEARALCRDGHVASVALLAREGGLPADRRAAMYEGGRVRGNMLPDVLTSQLRDERAGAPAGYRVMRIATHHAVRSRGLGSHLLERVREEVGDEVDWLGTGFGATPDLVDFWRENGYAAVHLSTTRNDASGEYSAIMLAPTSEAGRRLHDRHAGRFARRLPAVLSDGLSDLDPDVARAVLESVDATPPLPRSVDAWRTVAGAAYGPGLFDVDPGPFRRLVVRSLVDDPDEIAAGVTPREERLLVRRALQAEPWPSVADALDYHSPGQCMRSFGAALGPLVDRYGTDPDLAGADAAREVRSVRERFADE